MRPLTVRTERGSGPLPCRRLPVAGWGGGGGSRLLGGKAELQGGLVGLHAEAGEQVADLLLAVVDDLAGGGAVDRVGDVLAEALELVFELGHEVAGGSLGLRVHLPPNRGGKGRLGLPSRPSHPMTSRIFCQTPGKSARLPVAA